MTTRALTMTAVLMSVALIGVQPSELTASNPVAIGNAGASPRPAYRDITVPAGTTLPLVLDSYVASDQSRVEDRVQAHVRRDVLVGGRVAIPAGSSLTGYVTSVERSGRVQGTRSFRVPLHSAGGARGGTAAHQHQPGGATGACDQEEGCDHHRAAGRRRCDRRRNYRREERRGNRRGGRRRRGYGGRAIDARSRSAPRSRRIGRSHTARPDHGPGANRRRLIRHRGDKTGLISTTSFGLEVSSALAATPLERVANEDGGAGFSPPSLGRLKPAPPDVGEFRNVLLG